MRRAYKLTTKFVTQANLDPGVYGDGNRLALRVARGGSRSFIYSYVKDGKGHELGLGSAHPQIGISLVQAREKAAEFNAILASGGDPLSFKRERQEAAKLAAQPKVKPLSFLEFAKAHIERTKPAWRVRPGKASSDTEREWHRVIDTICGDFSSKAIADVSTADVILAIEPIWSTQNPTARKALAKIEAVLDAARARKLITGENPARFHRGLDSYFVKTGHRTKHFAALPYHEMPDLYRRLRAAGQRSTQALCFIILCATRTHETLMATWDQIDIDRAIWTIPADNAKTREPHRVPLSTEALAILNEQKEATGGKGFVFPGNGRGKPLSQMTAYVYLKRLLKDSGRDATVHGIARSSFRDWAGEETSFPHEVCEQALAHKAGSVVRAYRRGDALEKRRSLMNAWASYLTGASKENVVQLRTAAA